MFKYGLQSRAANDRVNTVAAASNKNIKFCTYAHT